MVGFIMIITFDGNGGFQSNKLHLKAYESTLDTYASNMCYYNVTQTGCQKVLIFYVYVSEALQWLSVFKVDRNSPISDEYLLEHSQYTGTTAAQAGLRLAIL